MASVITENGAEDYVVRILGFENGKWLNIGEDLGRKLKKVREILSKSTYTS